MGYRRRVRLRSTNRRLIPSRIGVSLKAFAIGAAELSALVESEIDLAAPFLAATLSTTYPSKSYEALMFRIFTLLRQRDLDGRVTSIHLTSSKLDGGPFLYVSIMSAS